MALITDITAVNHRTLISGASHLSPLVQVLLNIFKDLFAKNYFGFCRITLSESYIYFNYLKVVKIEILPTLLETIRATNTIMNGCMC